MPVLRKKIKKRVYGEDIALLEVKMKYTLKIFKDYFWFSLFCEKYYNYGKALLPVITLLMIFLMICSFACAWFDDVVFIKISAIVLCQ